MLLSLDVVTVVCLGYLCLVGKEAKQNLLLEKTKKKWLTLWDSLGARHWACSTAIVMAVVAVADVLVWLVTATAAVAVVLATVEETKTRRGGVLSRLLLPTRCQRNCVKQKKNKPKVNTKFHMLFLALCETYCKPKSVSDTYMYGSWSRSSCHTCCGCWVSVRNFSRIFLRMSLISLVIRFCDTAWDRRETNPQSKRQ